MATTTAPLLSFGASGQIAKTQVYSTWRGIPYVRRLVIPANPKSAAQQKTRSVFSYMSLTWKSAATLAQAPWTAFCTGQAFYNRNAFIGQNTKALRAGTTMTGLIGSPGAKGGIPPTLISAVGAAGAATVTFTNPTPPPGWAITANVALAMLQGDPHVMSTAKPVVAAGTTPFSTVTLSGLTAGVYVISAWLVWSKPDGTAAYSPSINTTATAT